MNSQVLLNRLPCYQSKSQSPSQSGNRTCRTGSPWLAVLTLITRIEDGLTAQPFTTVPSGRRNAKLDIEVCRHRLADGAGVGSGSAASGSHRRAEDRHREENQTGGSNYGRRRGGH
jgi:hypothetical protein